MEATGKNSLLIVDDDKFNLRMLSNILQPQYDVYTASSGKAAIEMAEELLPDLILLDIIMPEMDGYQVLKALKSNEATARIPVIFITGLSAGDGEKTGLELGAVDYINKPFNDEIVRLRVNQQMKIINQMRIIEKLSLIDHQTGLPNRRNFEDRLCTEWRRAIRNKGQISLLVIDIDHFKGYNDAFGHPQGDVALRAVAQIISGSLNRGTDFAARWGGEEFVVLLPDTDIDGALKVGEFIRSGVEAEDIFKSDGALTKLTLCVGANSCKPTLKCSLDEFIHKADEALYIAKNSGRNKVCGCELECKCECECGKTI